MKYLSIFFAMALFTFTACDEASETEESIDSSVVENNATANEDGESSNQAAQINFSETEHNFGTIQEGTQATYTFKFTNTGTSDLVISDAKPSCGCTVPTWTKEPLKPGDEGSIDVVYDSKGRPGSFTKTIQVTSNSEPALTVLTIKGEVQE
ncbi:MAG: DUF1573 domain-containing protein [Bacteroidia bacterium]